MKKRIMRERQDDDYDNILYDGMAIVGLILIFGIVAASIYTFGG